MENIESFLKRFKKIVSSNEDSQKVIIGVIKNLLGVDLKEENFDIKNGVLYIRAKPIIKNEIYFHKEKILKTLQEKGVLHVKDLR